MPGRVVEVGGRIAVDNLLQAIAYRIISVLVRFTAGIAGGGQAVEVIIAVVDRPGQSSQRARHLSCLLHTFQRPKATRQIGGVGSQQQAIHPQPILPQPERQRIQPALGHHQLRRLALRPAPLSGRNPADGDYLAP
jgi:hypothetical protein